ncbi:hypothetical protein [Phenylobacterium sp.]|uniref:hypothetical protein n=1 Tax=Phenylobacterium sp. TaxID=1871053 RepID=UPI0025F03DDA|nr:hypothetical protein [Phenylobacterium sp.]MBX3482504.1 hypothetical protein [Phenylobacterium sp.]
MARKYGFKPDRSEILATDWLATACHRERLRPPERIVDLSCGHKAVTRAARAMQCPRCTEMIRQGHDYEGWINNRQHVYDGMIWRADPCRHFNERTDLGGGFIDEPAPSGDANLPAP